MKTTALHPDLVYTALAAKPGRSERRHALERLHAICELRYQGGNTDFSIAVIGRECEVQGFIKARALYNAASADYKTLIEAWSVFGGLREESSNEQTVVDKPSRSTKRVDNYVSLISDPVIRANVLSLIEDRDSLKVRLNVATAENQVLKLELGKRVKVDATTTKRPRGRPLKHATEWALKPGDLSAITRAISPEFVKLQGWHFGMHGEVRNALGEVIYDPGYVQGIKKLLANENDSEQSLGYDK